jgi:hypothetical protein
MMKKILFTDGWKFAKAGEVLQDVILPHDAMIHEKRVNDGSSDGGHGYFPGGKYLYEKKFHAPTDWADQTVLLVFEGVYRHSVVTVNGRKAGGRAYGYVPFEVDLTPYLDWQGENTIQVEVDNSELPNSRWYSGSGIYRPVHVVTLPKTHIAYQGVRITTLSLSPAEIRVETETNGGEVTVEIMEAGNAIDRDAMTPGRKVATATGQDVAIRIPEAKLWSYDAPHLYQCKVTIWEAGEVVDQVAETFGIRQVSYSPGGLFINGKNTLLRGGCIHHDNGILGAATWSKAEERRVRILRENGFNAIRMSHNPASDALVAACDKYGMYLMDETFDMWYVRKTKYDYGRDFKDNWKQDTKAMVERDRNHPSVLMYSIGNEVSEPGKPEGVEQGKEIIAYIKHLDSSRIVTGGMNLMIMSQYAKGKGQYDNVDQEPKEDKKAKAADETPKNASFVFNMMAMMVGSGMNKAGNSDKVDQVTSPILDALDIAGYNYASGRYPMEGTKHPGRVILGSETFPGDIYKNWEMVKKYPYLVGDFMWTAWDYLGEAGIGCWSYTGGMPFNRPYPWILGGAGVIDILGNPDPTCKFAGVTWDQTQGPVIGVRPVNHPGIKVSKSVWRATNAVESWAWQGCDGNKAEIDVFAKGDHVELLVNGRSIGKKKLKNGQTLFHTKYAAGEITAVSYDAAGNKIGSSSLQSATGELHIHAVPEEESIAAGDIVYIPVTLTGANGVVECNADTLLSAEVKGGVLLGFGSANPCTREVYDAGRFTTYLGRALAVVYAPEPGVLQLTVSGKGLADAQAVVTVS